MKTSDILIVHPDSEDKFEALKAFMKAFKIKFEITKEKPYDPKFVAKIEKSQQDYKNGKGKKITLDELNSLWK
jgi:hypothetical protein